MRLYDLENLLDDISDDVFTEEEATVRLERSQREALDVAIDRALYEPDLESADPDEVVAIGRRFERLLALRAQLEPRPVTA